jgi:hypothetical protein
MDDDLSQENRIRLIGRLFFIYIVVALKAVEFERDNFVNFSQNILRKSSYLGFDWGQ